MDKEFYDYMVTEVLKDFSEGSFSLIINALYNLRDDVKENKNYTMKDVENALDYIIKFIKKYEESYNKIYDSFEERKNE